MKNKAEMVQMVHPMSFKGKKGNKLKTVQTVHWKE